MKYSCAGELFHAPCASTSQLLEVVVAGGEYSFAGEYSARHIAPY